MLQASDGSLLDSLRSGDGDAFRSLFERHWEPVYRVLYRVVGNREEAEDLAQEVFIKLYRQPLRAGREHNLPGWLYRVATNTAYNAIRSRRRWLARESMVGADVDSSPSPLDEAVVAEERRITRDVLATMIERQQSILILRHEGLSYREIADAVGVAPGSVGTLLARAEAEFRRRYLERQGGL